MKITTAAIAFLGLPSALAAAVAAPALNPRATPTAASSSTSLPVHNTFTSLTSPGRLATRTSLSLTRSSSTNAASTSPTGVTKLAPVTIANIAFTVTSASGVEAVDGFTLVPGGAPINLAGGQISAGASGKVFVDGAKLTFTVASASISSSAPAPVGGGSSSSQAAGSSSAAASGSASGAGSGGGGSNTSTGGAAVRTAGVGALLGALIGMVVL